MEEKTRKWYAKAHFNMGLAYHENDMLPQAKAEYEKALLIEPDYYEALNNLSEIFLRENDNIRAKAFLRKAAKISPERSLAYINLGKVLIKEEAFQEAVIAFRRAIVCEPGNINASFCMGQALFRLKNYPGALEYFENVEQADTEYPDLSYYMALSLTRLSRYDKALGYLKDLAGLNSSGSHKILNAIGIIYYRKNMKYEAAKYFKKSVSAKPESPTAHLNLAVILSEKGEYGQAISEYEKYLKYSPESEKTGKIKDIIKKLEEYRI